MTAMPEPRRVKACRLDELPDGSLQLFALAQRQVAICRIGDELFAIQNACPHFGAPLSEGQLSTSRKELICPWHRFRFDLTDGTSVTNRALAAVTFPVVVEDSDVFVVV
jgi:nitrite reductase/ring-hydroxylating ferredoxin subunit